MNKPKSLRKNWWDSQETRASKDFWWLVVQIEREKEKRCPVNL